MWICKLLLGQFFKGSGTCSTNPSSRLLFVLLLFFVFVFSLPARPDVGLLVVVVAVVGVVVVVVVALVPPGTSCGAFIQKHASIITIYLSLTHRYTKYFNSLTG